jgi:hypothetical protein
MNVHIYRYWACDASSRYVWPTLWNKLFKISGQSLFNVSLSLGVTPSAYWVQPSPNTSSDRSLTGVSLYAVCANQQLRQLTHHLFPTCLACKSHSLFHVCWLYMRLLAQLVCDCVGKRLHAPLPTIAPGMCLKLAIEWCVSIHLWCFSRHAIMSGNDSRNSITHSSPVVSRCQWTGSGQTCFSPIRWQLVCWLKLSTLWRWVGLIARRVRTT